MALGRPAFVFMVLTLFGTVISQPGLENKPFFEINENDVSVPSIEEIVKRYNFQVMDKLLGEMRKGFQDLRREFKLERTRRQDLDEKMEKCFAGIHEREHVGNLESTTNPTRNVKSTTNPTWNVKSMTNPTRNVKSTTNPTRNVKSTTNPTRNAKSTTNPTRNVKSTTNPTRNAKSTTNPTRNVKSTTNPTRNVKSTTNPTWNVKSTTNPTRNAKSTTNPTPTTSTMLSTTATIPKKETVDCSDGFSEFEDHCYMFETKKLNWSDARQACQDHGAYLVSVNTQDEQDFLVKQIKSYYKTDEWDYFWLGLTLVAGKELWADGTDVSYTQWADSNPDCMETHGCKAYISEFSDFSWEDANNKYRFFSVCELEKTQNGDERTAQTTIPSVAMSEVRACPPKSVRFEGHCYLFEMKKKNWRQAGRACRRRGAYLVSVNTQREQEFLVRQIKNHYSSRDTDYFWLGMSLKADKMVWADGKFVNYTQWADSNPDCMKSYGCKAYISEYSDFSWEDANSDYNFFSVCEM